MRYLTMFFISILSFLSVGCDSGSSFQPMPRVSYEMAEDHPIATSQPIPQKADFKIDAGLHAVDAPVEKIVEWASPSGPAGNEGGRNETTDFHIDFVRVFFDGKRIVGIGVKSILGDNVSVIGRTTGVAKDFQIGKGKILTEFWVTIEDGFTAGHGFIAGLYLHSETEAFVGGGQEMVIGHINANNVWDHKYSRTVTDRKPQGQHSTYSIVGFFGNVDKNHDLRSVGVLRQLVLPIGFCGTSECWEGPTGNETGFSFSDCEACSGNQITEVRCWIDDAGEFVTGLQIVSKKGEQPVNGFPNANRAFAYKLLPDEVVFGIRGVQTDVGLRTIVFVIQNLKTGQQTFRSAAPPNHVLGQSYGFELPRQTTPPLYPTATIYGFHGRYDKDRRHLMSIGAMFTPYNVVGPSQ